MDCMFRGVERRKEINKGHSKFYPSITVYLFADEEYIEDKGKSEIIVIDYKAESDDEEEDLMSKSDGESPYFDWSKYIKATSDLNPQDFIMTVCVIQEHVSVLTLFFFFQLIRPKL